MPGVEIPIEAKLQAGDLDAELAQLRQKINALGQAIAQANRVKFNPISKVTVDGSATIGGGLAVQGNGGASSVMKGNFAIEGGTLTHDGKNIGSDHEHSGVQSGGSNTGAPV